MNTVKYNEFFNCKGIRKLPNGNYEIASLLFKVKQLSLYDAEGHEIHIDYQVATLLKMFLEAEDHFLNKEDTINDLWKEASKAECRQAFYRRFNSCTRSLREALSRDEDIVLICKTKKGYQLIVKMKEGCF